MKIRYEYNNNELGWRLAQQQKMTYGGRVAVTQKEGRVFWYSPNYLPTEIMTELSGMDVEIDASTYLTYLTEL